VSTAAVRPALPLDRSQAQKAKAFVRVVGAGFATRACRPRRISLLTGVVASCALTFGLLPWRAITILQRVAVEGGGSRWTSERGTRGGSSCGCLPLSASRLEAGDPSESDASAPSVFAAARAVVAAARRGGGSHGQRQRGKGRRSQLSFLPLAPLNFSSFPPHSSLLPSANNVAHNAFPQTSSQAWHSFEGRDSSRPIAL
jgi:hypothetical protein